MNKKQRIAYIKERTSNQIACDRCGKASWAYYTLSRLTKGLWIICEHCGSHAAQYVDNLPIPYIPSKDYEKHILGAL